MSNLLNQIGILAIVCKIFKEKTFFITEETVSLESPPTEQNNGHSLSEIISTVLPENATEDSSQQSGGQNPSTNAKRGGAGNSSIINHNGQNVHNGPADLFLQQNRAPGSQFRNGSMTVRNYFYSKQNSSQVLKNNFLNDIKWHDMT